MVYAACFNNEIRLWWDKRTEKTEDMTYRVFVDAKWCVYTDYVYYNFKNLEGGRAYEFEVQLVDKNKQVVGKSQCLMVSTLPKRELVEVSMKGDASTDNTCTLQNLFSSNKAGKTLHIPAGVYLTDEVTFSGDIEVQMDAGAILCDSEKGLSL